ITEKPSETMPPVRIRVIRTAQSHSHQSRRSMTRIRSRRLDPESTSPSASNKESPMVFSLGLHLQRIGPNCWILGEWLFMKKHEACHPASLHQNPQAVVTPLGTEA